MLEKIKSLKKDLATLYQPVSTPPEPSTVSTENDTIPELETVPSLDKKLDETITKSPELEAHDETETNEENGDNILDDNILEDALSVYDSSDDDPQVESHDQTFTVESTKKQIGSDKSTEASKLGMVISYGS